MQMYEPTVAILIQTATDIKALALFTFFVLLRLTFMPISNAAFYSFNFSCSLPKYNLHLENSPLSCLIPTPTNMPLMFLAHSL